MINFKRTNKYCCEDISLIENYEAANNDTTQTWECHHRFETDKHMSVKELKDNDLYYGRPASELIFLTHSEHAKLHHPEGTKICEEAWNKNIKTPEEVRKKQSKSHIGLKYPNRKKVYPTEESNEKRRRAMTGRHRIYRADGSYYYSKKGAM